MKRAIFNSYLDRIKDEFGLTTEELVSRTKSTEILEYMEDINYSTTHASISHAVNVISDRMTNDRDYRKIVLKIKDDK